MDTERLILRPWEEKDSEELFRYASHPEVGPRAGWPAHVSLEESQAAIMGILSQPETYALVFKETGLPIGAMSLESGEATRLTDRCDECELGYWVGVPYWGRGLVPEAAREVLRHAFADLGMRAVWCSSDATNEQSQRV